MAESPRLARRLSNKAVKANTLLRAAEIVGGLDALCRYLSVPRDDLLSWMAEEADVPLAPFLLAVDIVLQDSEAYGLKAKSSRS
jgi:hypothetical protein